MKRYKLLKELPHLLIGTIIEVDDNLKIIRDEQKTTISREGGLNFLLSLIEDENINGWLEEIKEEKSIYNIGKGDTYYHIDLGEIIEKYINIHNMYEFEENLKLGNVFLTEQEAEKEREKRKALAYIKKWIYENKIKIKLNNDYSYIIAYNNTSEELKIVSTYYKEILGFNFKIEEDAEKCLQECKEQWNILFDLKD